MSQVVPVTSFPDNEVNVASAGLVQRHSTAFSNERILMKVRGCGVVLGVLCSTSVSEALGPCGARG